MNTGYSFTKLVFGSSKVADLMLASQRSWTIVSNEIPVLQLESDFLESWMEPLATRFGKLKPCLMKLPPSSWYNWHVDTNRFVCLNLLLDRDADSFTVFRQGGTSLLSSVARLVYDDKFVLFNTQVPHAVLNLSNRPRRLLSISFEKPVVYSAVKAFCSAQGLADQEHQAHQTSD